MRINFETTAFLTPLGQREMRGQSYYPAWHRYTLNIPEEKWKQICKKREELGERVARGEIPNARLRAYDRKIVNRYR